MYESDSLLLSSAVVITLASLAVVPLYIYGLLKWRRFSWHLFIVKRYPRTSETTVFMAAFTMVNEINYRWLKYFGTDILFLRSMGYANVFMIGCFVIMRLMFVFQRWSRYQKKLAAFLVNKGLTPAVTESPTRNPPNSNRLSRPADEANDMEELMMLFTAQQSRTQILLKYWRTIALTLYMLVGYICIFLGPVLDFPPSLRAMFWLGLIVPAVVLIWFIRSRNVKEGIGAVFEVYITIGYLVVICILLMTQQLSMEFGHDFMVRPIEYLFVALIVFPGLIPLYVPLYLVYDLEGSLDPVAVKRNRKELDNQLIDIPAASRIGSTHIIPETLSVDVGSPPTSSSGGKLNEFLETQSNYALFAEFLGNLFALENLSFLERASILSQIVLELKGRHPLNEEKEPEHGCAVYQGHGRLASRVLNVNNVEFSTLANSRRMKRIEFGYLSALYSEMRERIESVAGRGHRGNGSADRGFEHYRLALFKEHCLIYEEFIGSSADIGINLSHDTNLKLRTLFGMSRASNVLEAFDCFRDFNTFLYVFDTAIFEIYRILCTVWGRHYEEWLQKKEEKNKEE